MSYLRRIEEEAVANEKKKIALCKMQKEHVEMLEALKEYSVLKPLDAIGIIDGVCKLHNKTQKLIEKVEGK